ncbi:hypothetical protein Pyn_01199 [Prunus yedoensis var. nudiflora]|uniref:Uncharacterized protein n=1 Tax=Prunus yedoensis var. nudiflora TaxID=2094558 RepID=A0A314ZML9_PRUYE|nr:hypothetical protein Pyn_01199 [Prunus yedoensis var. nudiflora]
MQSYLGMTQDISISSITAKPVAIANYRNGHGYGQSYYNNHDYGYYNPNGTGSYHATTDPYHHQQYYPNYYEPKAPPWREIHPFYNPDTQCTIM